MVSVHGFAEVAQHAVGFGTGFSAVEMCSQAIMPKYRNSYNEDILQNDKDK